MLRCMFSSKTEDNEKPPNSSVECCIDSLQVELEHFKK